MLELLRAKLRAIAVLLSGSVAACAALLDLDGIAYAPADASVDAMEASVVPPDGWVFADAAVEAAVDADGESPDRLFAGAASFLVADDLGVYWAAGSNVYGPNRDDGGVSVGTIGAPVTALALDAFDLIVITAGQTYWYARSAPTLSQEGSGTVNTTVPTVAVDETRHVYRFEGNSLRRRLPPFAGGSVDEYMIPVISPGTALAYTAGALYFYGAIDSGTFGLQSCLPSDAGCTDFSTVLAVSGSPQVLAVQGTNVATSDSRGIGTANRLGSQTLTGGSARALAANSKSIFFAQDAEILRFNLAARTTVSVFPDKAQINALAVSSTYLYWATANGVYRVPLPE